MKERYYSLDVFRGMTVAFMIVVNNPAKWDAANIFRPLEHAPWQGCTPTDLVFPFFLFAVGNAMAFVMPRFQQAGNDWLFWKKITKRSLLIFGIGFLLLAWAPWFRYNEHNQLVFKAWEYDIVNCKGEIAQAGIRILGVLQRIALCYFFAAIFVYFTKQRGVLFFSAILLLLYWVICRFGSGHPDPYSVEGWVGREIDINLLGSRHIITEKVNDIKYAFDPEGLLSTIPAVVSVMLGYLVGDYIQRKGKSYEMLSNLFVAGAVLAGAGLLWGEVFPLNKKIWTSSYVVYTTGLAILTICVLIFLVEFKALNKMKGLGNIAGEKLVWLLAPVFLYIAARAAFGIPGNIDEYLRILFMILPVTAFFILLLTGNYFLQFFDVFGKNPLFIFFLSGFIPRLLGLIRIPNGGTPDCPAYMAPLSWLGEKVCIPAFGNPKAGSFLYSLILIMFFWAIAWYMDKRRLYVKV